ncbi:MAG: hypothetical protein G8237_12600 [Magnetococcales bacterium]|nr:hypothetical protein [Magnetococcales bacterium]NGZ07183.1 hypothetical protein [Magnetococcales bacterium]
MKKSILLGAAALAAVALAAPQSADAGEVKLGGYYQFRMVSTDNTPGDVAGDENLNFWAHRLQLNMDMKASDKSHAHLVTRIIDNQTVDGVDQILNGGAPGTSSGTLAPGVTTPTVSQATEWQVRQAWLETEAWGVGVKVGNMPISMNDGLLFDNDVTSYGTVLLSKNFGGVTLVGADVKVYEGSSPGGAPGSVGANVNHRDIDMWVLSALGKISNVDYQLTGAYLNAQDKLINPAAPAAPIFPAGVAAMNDVSDGWIALTLGGKVMNIDLTGTVIYEVGGDVTGGDGTSQFEESGVLLALRAKGKTGFGGWNAYAFYGSEDFDSATPGGNESKWSPTWDSSGAGSQDLMMRALSNFNGASSGLFGGSAGGNSWAATGGTYSSQENMWGVGAGLTINAGAWTIKPSLDYASVVQENETSRPAGSNFAATYESAWGGTLGFSTKIQEATTLDLSGTWVNPNARLAATSEETMHYIQASVKMDF